MSNTASVLLAPPIIVPNSSKDNPSHVYLHHKVEWIPPSSQNNASSFWKDPVIEKMRKATALVLITVGLCMTLTAACCISLQAMGIRIGIIPAYFGNLFMPGLVAILTGFHLPKEDSKNLAKFRIPTGIPGLSFQIA